MGNCIIARSGGGTNLYSTSETRIGTWVDGKPIYRKVVAVDAATVQGVSLASLKIDRIINMNIFGRDPVGDYIQMPYNNEFSNIFVYVDSSYVIQYNGTQAITSCTCIVEYTKTTD